MRAFLPFILLAGCTRVVSDVEEPLSLQLTSPTYGAYLGDGPIVVEGDVTPARTAQVLVDGVATWPDQVGHFRVEVPFVEGRRAQVIDVWALRGDEKLREIVPVFDASDPRELDPGGVTGLLTPGGLDALEPTVESLVESLAWEDQVLAAIPALETDWLSLTPTSLEAGTDVDLAPGEDDVSMAVTMEAITLTVEADVLGWLQFPIAISMDVTIGAHASPTLEDDMLGLTLTDAIVEIGEFGFAISGFEIPDSIMDLLGEPIGDLVSLVGDALGDALLEQVGTLELAGPFAFEFELGETSLAARLVEVGADLDGVGLGATVGVGEDAADELPEMNGLATTTPAGLDYHLGFAVHEGMLNAVVDGTLASFLDLEMELVGGMAEFVDPVMEELPGGDQLPSDREGWCLDLELGDARVVRMVPGQGAPLAQAWLPDVDVDLEVMVDGNCEDWLEAKMFAVIDLSLDGTAIGADFSVLETRVSDYAAADVQRDDVGGELGPLVEGLAGLLVGQLSFDLGDMLGAQLPIAPVLVSVEPLDETGLFGVYTTLE